MFVFFRITIFRLTVWREGTFAGSTVILDAGIGPPILIVGPLGAGGAAVIFCGLGGVMETCL